MNAQETPQSTQTTRVKLMLVVFLAVFLVGNVSALDWDNKLTYMDGENGNPDLKVQLENSFLGIFPMGVIGTIELKSHKSIDEIKQVPIGEGVVMWYEFDNFEDNYVGGLGEILLVDLKTGNSLNRDYSFVYWGNESHEQAIYSCDNKTGSCSQTGSEIILKEMWLPYNSKDIPTYSLTSSGVTGFLTTLA